MSKTATLAQDGYYDLSEPILPFSDGLSFMRLAYHASSGRMWLLGVGSDGQEHAAPLLPNEPVLSPAAALVALGYELA
ncbi:hypothetical protein GGQ86_002961 [Xanthobacter flavus]|uniref:Uncharacterized protein n=1 Tax=Xanthobacter flavus TaxID=281 RepID=A0A9W6CJA8_XANFL|nr:hypothetical protein [Xanthobacter flavus]MDR6334479.1 hypothetical protein [Xanthobacter flavus]GLI23501.1 hypothetical protein XFLAVUS301_31750 [Xanthobacter flavus]